LSFLAVLSALVAPVSVLAQDVGSGKLSGLCYAEPMVGGAQQGAPESAQPGGHCSLCASAGLPPPPLAAPSQALVFSHALALRMAPSDRAVIVSGLPFSRGPPAVN
jgi:hypothetical protein